MKKISAAQIVAAKIFIDSFLCLALQEPIKKLARVLAVVVQQRRVVHVNR
jgi:hypothetical protein